MTDGMDNNGRILNRPPAGCFFGRMGVENPMWKDEWGKQGGIFEPVYNKTLEIIQTFSGRPVVRSRTVPQGIRKTTQVPGGANLAESIDGDSYNFGGVTPFIMDDRHIAVVTTQPGGAIIRQGTDDRRTLFVPLFTTAPTPGDTLTQAVTGATMRVTTVTIADAVMTAALTRTHFTLYNMVTGIDLHTGTWNTANNVTSNNLSGSVMAPTPVVPVMIENCDEMLANVDVLPAVLVDYQPTHPDYELVYVMRRGITMAWCNDTNGAIAIGTPLTWCDYEDAFVAANYHTTTHTMNGDNIVAVAMQAHSGGNYEELLKVYLFADCPIVYFGAGVATTPGEQGAGNPGQI